MKLFIKEMDDGFAREILHWKYSPPYDFYNNEFSEEALRELLEESYYAIVSSERELIGYFCTGKTAQVPIGSQFGAYSKDLLDIGIGMKPALTGQGYGSEFFGFILAHIADSTPYKTIRLTVTDFNSRAISLYEKHGFVKNLEFNRGETKFITMIKE
ncbi:GNAT family N-acetyltransferase [Mesobacillus maritimus]|jgi:[ribosomal protein S18]-alanine N-acetyltransferase|uniref:GNAT family N-acetyltransferase n=1 Tax=Mesobacillus maritimus TaxID=1643336 RepID=A0ABS7JZZ8_9BACI|nr:GNAT family N-acetyltransferase [Mesobacillus maritimus]MBY0095578.1 GNAT family N-acetyltransferase [Mesobacillus maritimus]